MNLGVLGLRIRRATWLYATIAFALLLFAAPAHATFPGKNGKIAFVSDRDGNFEIYTMNPDGSSVTRLTDNPGVDLFPAWSADGKKIAFSSNRGDSNGGNIYVMNADGSGVTRLTTIGHSDEPAWSPDGTEIAFEHFPDIWTIAPDGTGLRQLASIPPCEDFSHCTSFSWPTWSPDGSTIAFEGTEVDDQGDFVQQDIWKTTGTTGPTNITNTSNFNEASPDWSPDGARIAFWGGPLFDGADAWTINANGLDRTRLTTDPEFDAEPAWSPDGSRLAFISHRTGTYDIYVMNADGTGQTNITNNPATFDIEPDWQPIPGPRRSDYKNAAQFCKAGRDFLGAEAFAKKYGTSSNGANAFGKCVSQNN